MAEGTAKPEQVKALAEAGVTCISIETSRYPDGSRAMTRPMGEIAGRTAVLLGGQYLQRQYGGSGVSIVPIIVPVGLGCAFWAVATPECVRPRLPRAWVLKWSF